SGDRMRAVRRLRFSEREAPFGYALVVPALLYLTAFIAYPFAMSIWLSVTDAQAGAQKWNWVGFDNYSKVESYDLLGNDFVIAEKLPPAELQALVDKRKDGKVVVAPDGARFKASLQIGDKAIPVISSETEDGATYLANTMLNDLDWTIRDGKVIAHSGDSPLALSN